ncbi:MAG: ATP-dependent RecD-like DNA helicase [Thermodesulfobacteriota bacterium]
MHTVLKAEVKSVTFFNPLTNYLVARVRAEGEPGDLVVVGCMGQVQPGELLTLTGSFKDHPKWGRQFEVAAFEQALPATQHGVRNYLASGLIRGVGEKLADRLVAAFGADVLDILDRDPERLLAVDGVGKKKLAQMRASWEAQREVRSLLLFLQEHDVPPTYASRIFQKYGAGAVAKLQENPYELAYDIRGVGFRTADRMALKLGFAPDCRERIQAALVWTLFCLSEQGHLYFPLADLGAEAAGLLGNGEGGVAEEAVMAAVRALEEQKRIVVEDLPALGVEQAVFLIHFYRYEREIAARLHALAGHPAPLKRDKARKALPQVEQEAGIELSPEQREAVELGLFSKVLVITGGPGTGKTTITRVLARVLDKLGLKLRLAAPTGRAAKRLAEATGFPASTLHRLLEFAPDGAFARNEESKLKADAVVVDESSMLDAPLALHLLRALPLTCRLVLIGDVNQLPSVGPGQVLGDVIASQAVPVARLTHIFRQAAESRIVRNAHRINRGEFPENDERAAPDADFFWITQEEPARVRDTILDLVTERIPRTFGLDPRRDIQVLAPMHKGEVGTQALNVLLQERLNPHGRELRRGKLVLREGDRVLQLRNNYDKDVFNGDLGWITAADPESGELTVDFDGLRADYGPADLDELAPAYCISVHKSQGSEYPAVVVPVLTQHYLLLQRNLIYTALTRARRLAVIVGGRRAMALGLKRETGRRRCTCLQMRLQEMAPED